MTGRSESIPASMESSSEQLRFEEHWKTAPLYYSKTGKLSHEVDIQI